MTAKELVTNGIWDPIRLFVKDEPHSKRKADNSMWRLISNVSLRTQLIERLCCSVQNNAEIAQWDICSSKPGLGLHDAGLEKLTEHIQYNIECNTGIAAIDVEGWDWSVREWTMELDTQRRIRLSDDGFPNDFWNFLLRVRSYCILRSIFVLPNGNLVEQMSPGMQKSGSYCTSPTNSSMSILTEGAALARLRKLRKYKPGISMGDDALVAPEPALKEIYTLWGYKARIFTVFPSIHGVDFCSHEWKSDRYPEFVGWPKTMFRFLSTKDSVDDWPDRLAQLDYVLRHHPRKLELMAVAFARAERAKYFVAPHYATTTTTQQCYDWSSENPTDDGNVLRGFADDCSIGHSRY